MVRADLSRLSSAEYSGEATGRKGFIPFLVLYQPKVMWVDSDRSRTESTVVAGSENMDALLLLGG